MANKTMRLEIVSAESLVFEGQVTLVIAEGEDGELGIHPGHTALLTLIKPGQLCAQVVGEAKERLFYISGGILEIQPAVVTVLADTAVRAEDLDEAAAIAVQEQARKRLSDKATEMNYTKAMTELAEAAAQLRAIRRLREGLRQH